MKKNIWIISLFFILKANASPWINISDKDLINYENELNYYCDLKLNFIFSPISISDLYYLVEENKNETKLCHDFLIKFNNFLDSNYTKNKSSIGYQSKADDLYLNRLGDRFYDKSNIFYSHKSSLNNFTYKLRVTKSENDIFFDDSYIAFLLGNNFVVKAGYQNKWWSPSKNSSLILSNSARPFPTISVSNYKKINLESSFLKPLRFLDYNFFIGKLENNRDIPNALVFGNRISFRPRSEFLFSIMRVAQFGGDGRSVNSKTLRNMILGKDTVNTNMSQAEHPGNQLAGVDFSYQNKLKRMGSYKIYGQFFGEDGPDPLNKTLSFIKFPSKRFGLYGISYSSKSYNKTYVINLEHIDTNTGFKNVTYNHAIYTSGYRYKGDPIGAHIDTDSRRSIISIENYSTDNDLKLKLKFQDIKLNENNYDNSKWGSSRQEFKEYSIEISRNIFNNLHLETQYSYRDIETEDYRKNLLLIKLTYNL